jgi:hypothetical protein
MSEGGELGQGGWEGTGWRALFPPKDFQFGQLKQHLSLCEVERRSPPM